MPVESKVPVTADDVGKTFIDQEGDLWKMVAFTPQPTVTWQLVGNPGRQLTSVVSAPLARQMLRLIPENEAFEAGRTVVGSASNLRSFIEDTVAEYGLRLGSEWLAEARKLIGDS